MHTYSPIPDEGDDNLEGLPPEVIRSVLRRRRLINAMYHLSLNVTSHDFTGLTGHTEKVQYRHDHKSMKRKGGKPPMDYTAVEILVDFRRALNQGLYEEALPLYYSLRKLLRWDA